MRFVFLLFCFTLIFLENYYCLPRILFWIVKRERERGRNKLNFFFFYVPLTTRIRNSFHFGSDRRVAWTNNRSTSSSSGGKDNGRGEPRSSRVVSSSRMSSKPVKAAQQRASECRNYYIIPKQTPFNSSLSFFLSSLSFFNPITEIIPSFFYPQKRKILSLIYLILIISPPKRDKIQNW